MPDWSADYAALAAADRADRLDPPGLERLAVAATMLGHDDEVVVLRERAVEAYLAAGETDRAIDCGFWLGFHLQTKGAWARASGWLERLTRLARGAAPHAAALLDAARAAGLMSAGDVAAALELFERSMRVVGLERNVDHYVLARLGQGRCLQMLGREVEARVALDEAMVHVAAGHVQPQVVGLAYCSMIELCRGWYDIRRAQEWTEALTEWVEEQEGMRAYRGTCLVHRAEFLQLRGRWPEAVAQADDACERLREVGERAAAPAHYRVAELARLRGHFDTAEREYELAAAVGHEVQPGLARLRLAQSRPESALAGLDRAIGEGRDPRALPELLCARIEVCLASGDVSGGRETLDRLDAELGASIAPFLRAMVDHAAGTVLGAEDDWASALPRLRQAWETWSGQGARYEAAVAQLALARACAELGDADAATMESAAARRSLDAIGATGATDVTGAKGALGPPGATGATSAKARSGSGPDDCPLSPRELEVLRILATGATNRAMAAQLVLSEKTVARHVSNIFVKLGVTSRSAATARAFERHWS